MKMFIEIFFRKVQAGQTVDLHGDLCPEKLKYPIDSDIFLKIIVG